MATYVVVFLLAALTVASVKSCCLPDKFTSEFFITMNGTRVGPEGDERFVPFIQGNWTVDFVEQKVLEKVSITSIRRNEQHEDEFTFYLDAKKGISFIDFGNGCSGSRTEGKIGKDWQCIIGDKSFATPGKKAGSSQFYNVDFLTILFGTLKVAKDTCFPEEGHFVVRLPFSDMIDVDVQFERRAEIDASVFKEPCKPEMFSRHTIPVLSVHQLKNLLIRGDPYESGESSRSSGSAPSSDSSEDDSSDSESEDDTSESSRSSRSAPSSDSSENDSSDSESRSSRSTESNDINEDDEADDDTSEASRSSRSVNGNDISEDNSSDTESVDDTNEASRSSRSAETNDINEDDEAEDDTSESSRSSRSAPSSDSSEFDSSDSESEVDTSESSRSSRSAPSSDSSENDSSDSESRSSRSAESKEKDTKRK